MFYEKYGKKLSLTCLPLPVGGIPNCGTNFLSVTRKKSYKERVTRLDAAFREEKIAKRETPNSSRFALVEQRRFLSAPRKDRFAQERRGIEAGENSRKAKAKQPNNIMRDFMDFNPATTK